MITFTVQEKSVIRVYTQPHVVDIDCALYLPGDFNPIASGNFTFNEEESFVYELKPNTTYILELTFWGSSSDCQTFNMEVAIIPSSLFALPEKNCPGNLVSHWPPSPSATQSLPSTPYRYNSVELGEPLYYQQNIFRTRAPPINFVLRASSNIHIELGYHFGSGDLLMRLSNTDNSELYWGVNQLNGNTINVADLSPGNYSLVIMEVTSNLPNYLGCSHFTFELQIDPSTKSSLGTGYSSIPSNLDLIPFLKYDGQVHLSESYNMFQNLPSRQEETTFTLTKESLMRVSTAHYKSNMDAIQLVLYKDNTIYSAFHETLLEILPTGSYRLRFNKPSLLNVTANSVVIVEVQLAISPTEVITRDLNAYQPKADCKNSLFPSVVVNPQGAYQFSNDSLQISQTTTKTQTTIQTVPIQLTRPSVIFARIGYNFLLSDLELSLVGNKSEGGKPVRIYGRNGRNTNEFNELLPAGSYQLILSQEKMFNFPGADRFPHCSVFFARFFIMDAANERTHTDCSTLDLLPWDLNSPTGGSQYFGGPVRDGLLHMMGESFMMPSVDGQVNNMNVSIIRTSILSIMTKQPYFSDIVYSVVGGASSVTVEAAATANFFFQKAEIYVLHERERSTLPTDFSIELQYNGVPIMTACPYFALQISMKTLSQVSQDLACPQKIEDKSPNQNVVPNAMGIYSEYLNSYFTYRTLYPTANSTRFSYEIKLDLKNSSRLIANLGFNSLVNLYDVLLVAQRNSYRYGIGRGSFTLQQNPSGNTDTNLLLSYTIQPGIYYIVISQPRFQLPILATIGTTRCFPFIWDLQIIPNTDIPYIPSVSPPAGSYLSPLDQLEIDITFSNAIYSGGSPVISSGPLTRAFYLYEINSPSIKIFAAAASPETSENTWHIIFSPTNFVTKKTYKLGLVNGVLTDQNGVAVQLLTTHTYTMIDTTCNSKGTFDRGYCFCKDGYAGDECTTCDIGFVNVDTTGGLNCAKQSGHLCLESSCGCKPNTSPCVKLGSCDDSTGKIVCSCYDHYGGPTCTQCAAGYTDFNRGCVKIPSGCPNCTHGNCDIASLTCICDLHYRGKTCDECNDGWTGSDCSQEVQTNKPISSSVGLTSFTVSEKQFLLY